MPSPTANPGPLGLLGFGLTTFLLNVHNAGGYEMNTMIIGMGLMFGGFAQLVAGLLEWKRGNLFPFIAFTSYGCFWISFILIFSWPATGKPDTNALGCYTFIWGVFSFGMWIATLKKAPWGLVVLFLTVWVLFFLLAIHFFSGSKGVLVLAGVEGIFCGLLAIYLAFCELLNEIYGRPVLPMGVRK
jgi:succinate-acetate transporter protein